MRSVKTIVIAALPALQKRLARSQPTAPVCETGGGCGATSSLRTKAMLASEAISLIAYRSTSAILRLNQFMNSRGQQAIVR